MRAYMDQNGYEAFRNISIDTVSNHFKLSTKLTTNKLFQQIFVKRGFEFNREV